MVRPISRFGATIALLLASCARLPPPVPSPAESAAAAHVCRVTPDGRPVVERGIGGTGAPPTTAVAERGIGGTGTPSTTIAERGIGGTGIIGVVTGFASVCLDGREVAFDPGVSVALEGKPASIDALRAGQVAVIAADGDPAALYARKIEIRYEVVGPIETVGVGQLRVAGQLVFVSASTWVSFAPLAGQWVAVSGLREPDGPIRATRLDQADPGVVIVHGVLQADAGTLRIGDLPIRPIHPFPIVLGQGVTATGTYVAGVLHAQTIVPDLLWNDPVDYFGPLTTSFVFEGFATADDGFVRLGTRLRLSAPPGFQSTGAAPGILQFERLHDGSLRFETLTPGVDTGRALRRFDGFPGRGDSDLAPTPTRDAAGPAGRQFTPAPTPNRSFGGASGASRGSPLFSAPFGPGSIGGHSAVDGAAQSSGSGFGSGIGGSPGAAGGFGPGPGTGAPAGPPGRR